MRPRASSGWAQVIEMVGLTQAADRKIKGFSGGMKRRVGIAQALVNDPRILIVDEPTAGLDPEERIRFRNLLVDLATDRVVILSTHIVEDIGQTCRDMAVLSKGQILFRGSPLELTRAAEGRVWTVLSQRRAQTQQRPDGGLDAAHGRGRAVPPGGRGRPRVPGSPALPSPGWKTATSG